MKTVKHVILRAVRTAVQAFLGVYMTANFVLASQFADVSVLDMAAGAGLAAAIAVVWNALEEWQDVGYDRG
jgi:predicted nicotinamide N-methyase